MAAPQLVEQLGLRIAVEGCGHGVLHAIYASVAEACKLKGWPDVDLLIIGGDFQAVRNASDLKAVSMPSKYYAMHDFHEYYSGARLAPYLTLFIGGNHEASNYMWELYYGGWAAPKIYYMGAANVVRLGPLRIAGLSGIWKGYNYKKPHYERLPYNSDDVRSIYHVRELDVRKLLQIRTQVDIGLSHDWPRGMEWKGNYRQLFSWKPDFEQEAKDGTLGSVAAKAVLERLRPPYWFSAHMHAKFPAVWEHAEIQNDTPSKTDAGDVAPTVINEGEIDLDVSDGEPPVAPKNDAEIDLDMDEVEVPPVTAENKGPTKSTTVDTPSEVPQDIRKLLPESFSRPILEPIPTLPFPKEITNKTTKFLALDKCLPKRSFLQLLEIESYAPAELQRPLQLHYDKEWLAITRVFADHLQVGDPHAQVPTDKGDAFYQPLVEKEMDWVEQNIVQTNNMAIPENFAQTAPVYDPALGIHVRDPPQEYSNPHTQTFCDLLQIPNVFDASDEERSRMAQNGPRPEQERSNRGGGRGGGGSRGGGRGHGHGHGHGQRGRGRGGRGGRSRGRW
ncbi:lariat debranching enzyme [Pyrenophora tritici-repentis]|uniref:Lariat debranching enzyme n=2 Tax=Pyrenophora tritici-repentis TaxID=45151 RepID=A0A2W1ER78_9PLEO|nr:lariat debranching enzyme [Pyrenophora tritici-repentis Pt-1C-BFP]KAA8625427.1 Lariat debranching enzyme [Pyrenophora tritici-repentis]EDU40237.1 lariat debranching enzyme [Pyrenophora tritici-repentis Pt-1C-BFP]KAF7453826.1 Lariat debranching enzyme [Pyrenophora tritici-repentis]KAF7576919.1 lariat debranching enzyme [Pyrenophora tritici-repentis]KAG9387587.1 Lariat debranching enzyme [Pyrenophora tritici-repentis]